MGQTGAGVAPTLPDKRPRDRFGSVRRYFSGDKAGGLRSSGLATGSFIVTITFSEDVTDFNSSQLQVTGSGVVGPAFVTKTGSVYTERIISTLVRS